MGFGKILGLAALGIGAVAAAPFTGGGSILAATGAAASLAGAGTVAAAAGAGVVGAAAGAAMSRKEEEEEEARRVHEAKTNMELDKFKNIAEEHELHTNTIIALTACGVAMANADGEISSEEIEELNEFVNGLSGMNLPDHIVETINDLIENPPTFREALNYLEKIEIKDFQGVRDMLILVMEADGLIVEKEKAFLEAFDRKTSQLAA